MMDAPRQEDWASWFVGAGRSRAERPACHRGIVRTWESGNQRFSLGKFAKNLFAPTVVLGKIPRRLFRMVEKSNIGCLFATRKGCVLATSQADSH